MKLKRSLDKFISYIIMTVSLAIYISCSVENEKTDFETFTITKEVVIEDSSSTKPVDNKKFSSDEWKQSSSKERMQYLDDIVKSDLLLGKSIEQVKTLLGSWDGEFAEDTIFYKVISNYKNPEDNSDIIYLLIVNLSAGYVKNVYISD